MNPLTHFNQRTREDWLIGYDMRKLADLAKHAAHQVEIARSRLTHDVPLTIAIADPDPIQFLAGLMATCSTPCQVFICNPHWAKSEWQQVFEQIQPDLMWGQPDPKTINRQPPTVNRQNPTSLLMVPTGGSSGKVRFVMHTWETLAESVRGFQQFFGVEQVNSLCVLPLYHVSGLMQFLRSLLSGGKLAIAPFKSLEAGTLPPIDPREFFFSLVPTQLQRLLLTPRPSPLTSPWLASFHTILLGGAPAWTELLEQARQLSIPLAPTYGMTETASQIATLKPTQFLQGQSGAGEVLPHATITIRDTAGKALGANQTGMIGIRARSLALGYYPHCFTQSEFQPDDLGFLDEQGVLHIVGRQTDKIITGGENVFPAEVEAAIRATGFVQDVCVVGVSDRQWGEAIAAVYVPCDRGLSTAESSDLTALKTALTAQLSKYKQPKHWLAVPTLPRNAQGKLNRAQIKQRVQAHLSSETANP